MNHPLRFFKDLRQRYEALGSAVIEVLAAARELRIVGDSLHSRLTDRERDVDPTYVYLLPPYAEQSPAMMVQALRVPKATTGYIRFTPYVPIPAGSWIVAVGPATVSGVKVGNCFQSSMPDYQGHVCLTKEPAELGVVITVELRG